MYSVIERFGWECAREAAQKARVREARKSFEAQVSMLRRLMASSGWSAEETVRMAGIVESEKARFVGALARD